MWGTTEILTLWPGSQRKSTNVPLDEMLAPFMVLFMTVPGSAFSKTDQSFISCDRLHSQSLHGQNWLLVLSTSARQKAPPHPWRGRWGQVELLLPSQRWRPPFRTCSLQKLPYQKNNKGVCPWRNHFGRVTTAESGHILQHSNGKVSQEEPSGGLFN